MRKQSDASFADCGVIRRDEMYRLDDAKKRLGLADHAMRQARRKGLLIRYISGRGFLLGADIIDFVREHGQLSK